MKKNKIKKLLFLIPFLFSSCQTIDDSKSIHNLLEHQFNKEVIKEEATCLEDGKKILECECGATIEEKNSCKRT